MKVLVLGKNGMLGNIVYNYFNEKNEQVLGTARKNEGIYFDAYQSQETLESIIKEYNPEVVINCIGILNKEAENNKELAVKVNSLLPHYIDSLSYKYGFKFTHISTDCVFEGIRGDYIETDYPDATSFYGRTKALGEIINNKNVTLRTSIIGPDDNPLGVGLFEWFMKQEKMVYGYKEVLWTGVTTIELAKAIDKAIKYDLAGIQHVVNNEKISKYDLLKLFSEIFHKDINIIENKDVKTQKTLIRTEKSFDFEISSYRQMMIEMKEWMIEHKNICEKSLARRLL